MTEMPMGSATAKALNMRMSLQKDAMKRKTEELLFQEESNRKGSRSKI